MEKQLLDILSVLKRIKHLRATHTIPLETFLKLEPYQIKHHACERLALGMAYEIVKELAKGEAIALVEKRQQYSALFVADAVVMRPDDLAQLIAAFATMVQYFGLEEMNIAPQRKPNAEIEAVARELEAGQIKKDPAE